MSTRIPFGPQPVIFNADSEDARKEWGIFLQRREELYGQIMDKIGARNSYTPTGSPEMNAELMDQAETDLLDMSIERAFTDSPTFGNPKPNFRGQYGTSEYNDLLGSADFYGIQNPENYEPDVLQTVLETARIHHRATLEDDPTGILSIFGKTLYSGSVGALFDVAQKVPFVGDFLAKQEWMQDSDRFLNSIKESARASMYEDEEASWRVGYTLSGLLGYAIPAAAAWGMSGAAMGAAGLGATVSPIARMALQGAATSWLLEGGGDAPLTQRGISVGLGALAGAGIGKGGGVAAGALMAPIGAAVGYSIDESPLGAVTGGVMGFAAGLALPMLLAKAQRSYPSRFYPDAQAGLGARPKPPPGGPRPPGFEDIPEAQWEIIKGDLPPGMAEAPATRAAPGQSFSPDSPAVPTEISSPREMGINDPSRLLGTPQSNEVNALKAALSRMTEQRNIEFRAANVSPVTELPNRRAFDLAVHAADADPNMSVVVADGNKFKSINDAHGHSVGDQVLRGLGGSLVSLSNQMQIPARVFHFGGDEFAALVPSDMAEEFTSRVAEVSKMTLSNGITTYLDAIAAPTFEEADLNLMNFKENNRGPRYGETSPQATSLEQYRQQGFNVDLPLYHGTSQIFDKFNPSPFTEDIWFSSSPEEASNYSTGEAGVGSGVTPNVHPVYARTQNPYVAQSVREYNQIGAVELKRRGYDSVIIPDMGGNTHVGVFDPKNIASQFDVHRTDQLSPVQAAQEGTILSKHQRIMESPALPEIGKNTIFSDYDVFTATAATNPGQTVTTRNIGDPGKFMEIMIAKGEINPENVRLVSRGDQLDAIYSPKGNVDKLAAQYERSGLYNGLRVLDSDGGEGVVANITKDGTRVVVRPLYGGKFTSLPIEDVLPRSAGSDIGDWVEDGFDLRRDAYGQFREYAAREFAMETLEAELPYQLDWTSAQVQSQLPRYAIDWLKAQNEAAGGPIMPAQELMEIISKGYMEDLKALAPEEWAAADQMVSEAIDLQNKRVESGKVTPATTENLANARGFDFLINDDGVSGTLRDQHSQLKVPVENEAAAREFLQNYDRETPDLNPIADLPAEMAAPIMGGEGPTEGPEPSGIDTADLTEKAENLAAALEKEFENITRNQVRRSPGGSHVGPPNPPGGGNVGPPIPPGGPIVPGGDDSYGAQFQRLRKKDPIRLYRSMRKMDSIVLRLLEPMRNYSLITQQTIQNDLGIDAKLWEEYAAVTNGAGVAHNEMIPHQEEWSDIVGDFGSKIRRDGTVVRIEQISDPKKKLKAMEEAGYSPLEMEAQARIRPFFDKLWEIARETSPIGYVFDYLPALRRMQAMGSRQDPFTAWETSLPEDWKWFARYPRAYGVQARHADIGTLGTVYIRGLFFERNVAPAWNDMRAKWTDPRIPDELRVPVTGWLDMVLSGVGPQNDILVTGFRHVLNKIGVPVTDSEVRSMWGGAFGMMYRAGLGLNPYHIFRDSIQPIFQGTEQGFQYTARAYTKWLTGGAQAREAMWDRAIRYGYVEKGQTQVAMAEVFSQPATNSEGQQVFTNREQAIRESIATIMDRIYDSTPKGLKQGIQGTGLDPLLGYTKLGEFNRLISGEAGWIKAQDALTKYVNREITFEQLVKKSGAGFYPKPITDKFKSLVQSGQVEEAVALMAQEAANSQFRYGTKEQAVMIQQAGTKGKLAMMYGTFSTQYIARMRDALGSQDRGEAMGFVARQVAVWAAISAAAAYTGWKGIQRWKWHRSLSFGGGPLAQSAVKTAQAIPGVINQAFGENPTPEQRSAMAQFGMRSPLSTFNPYQGAIRLATGLGNTLQSPFPIDNTAKLLLTGDYGTGSNFRQRFDNYDGAWTTGVSPQTEEAAHAKITPDDINQLLSNPPTRLNQPQPPAGDSLTIVKDIGALAPEAQGSFNALMKAVRAEGYNIQPTETRRSQARQDHLWNLGRSLPGNIVTWTKNSNHHGGNAVDFLINGDTSGRDPGYARMRALAPQFGLSLLQSEAGHVELSGGGARQ